MLVVTCEQKVRDPQGNIVSYILVDETGDRRPVLPLPLKDAIFKGQVTVTNLKLTSDGRLIDSKPEEINKENDVVSKRDLNAAIKLVGATNYFLDALMTKKELSLASRILDKYNHDTAKFKLETGETIKLPVIKIRVYRDGTLYNRVAKLKISSRKIIDSMPDTADEFEVLTIGVDATLKKQIRDGENVLCDYQVYCGWLDNNGNVINTPVTDSLAALYNSTLDLIEYATYDSIMKGNQGELEGISEGKHLKASVKFKVGDSAYKVSQGDNKQPTTVLDTYANSSHLMLSYDIIKTLGLLDELHGISGLQIKAVLGFLDKLFKSAVRKALQNGVNTADREFINELAMEHFTKAQSNAAEAIRISGEVGINNTAAYLHEQAQMEKAKQTAKKVKSQGLFNAFKR